MDKLVEWLTYLGCLFSKLIEFGYGDPAKSQGGSTATGAAWQLICSYKDNSILLMLRVTGANEIEIADNDPGPSGVGFPLPKDTPVALDRKKGVLYARSTAGASTLAWYISARNMTD